MGLTWVAQLSRFKGCNLFKEGQYEEALDAFTKAISIEPGEINGYSNRCAVLIKLNRWEEVVNDASRCLELDPTHAISLDRKARALFNLGCYGDAIENAEKAAAINPKLAKRMKNMKMKCEAALAQGHEHLTLAAGDVGVDAALPPPDSSSPSKQAASAEAGAPPLGLPGPATPRPVSETVKPAPQSPETATPPPPVPVELSVGEEALEEGEDERWPEMIQLEALQAEIEAFYMKNTPEKKFEAIADFTTALELAPSAAYCDVINAALQGRAEARTAVRNSLEEDTQAVEAKVKESIKFGKEMAVKARKFANLFLKHDARHREAVRARNAEQQRHNNLRRGGVPAQAV